MTELDLASAALGELDGHTAARIVAAAADVSLVIDDGGVVRHMAFGGDGTLEKQLSAFRGMPFVETVTAESRGKVRDLIREAASGEARPREISHLGPAGASLPIRYSAVRGLQQGYVLVIGRDLGGVSTLEQRLSSTQAAMERDYARLRAAEARYRILFHLTGEAVLIVDAASRRIIESNPAAGVALGAGGSKLVGRTLPQLFDASANGALQGLVAQAIATGDSSVSGILSGDSPVMLDLKASLFRQEGSQLLIVRLLPKQATESAIASGAPIVLNVIDALPDALIATDLQGVILEANAAFLDIVQVATVEQARGRRIEAWFSRGAADFEAISGLLSTDGNVRGYSAVMRGAYGSAEDVDVSAVRVKGAMPCIGFSIRPRARPRTLEARLRADMPRSVDELTSLVGRVPMKELIRETTDIIERLCIEAALQMTGDNRASAAELLGLSRQSLYAKLHRFGIAEMGEDA